MIKADPDEGSEQVSGAKRAAVAVCLTVGPVMHVMIAAD